MPILIFTSIINTGAAITPHTRPFVSLLCCSRDMWRAEENTIMQQVCRLTVYGTGKRPVVYKVLTNRDLNARSIRPTRCWRWKLDLQKYPVVYLVYSIWIFALFSSRLILQFLISNREFFEIFNPLPLLPLDIFGKYSNHTFCHLFVINIVHTPYPITITHYHNTIYPTYFHWYLTLIQLIGT